jgi:Glycosyl transferase family 2
MGGFVLKRMKMSDIYALTVGKNEECRYLQSFLENVGEWANYHFFYDDQSDDDTAELAQDWADVRIRPDGIPSFKDDEGMFRQAAWSTFETVMDPREGDWIFVIDCDEVVVGSTDRPIRESIEAVVNTVLYGAVSIAFHEVFDVAEGGVPLLRIDGFWGQGFAPRLFSYQIGGIFHHGKVGVPAVPSYVMAQSGRWHQTNEISVMHYGYADKEDLIVKHSRYNGVPGHHPAHIASILAPPVLAPWGGPLPDIEMIYGDC